MSRICLKQLQLVNWYGFTDTTIPFSDDLTLITGENESGKSTILDAIKYAYTGDVQFNRSGAAGGGIGKRNILSYTRCLMDASAGIYARDAENFPTVLSHIALTYEDALHKSRFTLGVVIETGAADVRNNNWYVYDLKEEEELHFIYEEGGVKKTFDAKGLQDRYGMRMLQKKDGITLFMQRLGLKLPFRDVSKYQRKLRNIMAYNPGAKIQDFIKESVLEEHDVKFEKLKEAKKNIEEINENLSRINTELNDLDQILKDFAEHDKLDRRIQIDEVKKIYKRLIKIRDEIKEAEETLERYRTEISLLEKKIGEADIDISREEEQYYELERSLRTMEVYQAIQRSEELIKEYSIRLEKYRKDMEELEQFEERITKAFDRVLQHGDIPDIPSPVQLTSLSAKEEEKKLYVDQLKKVFEQHRDSLVVERGRLEDRGRELRNGILIQQDIISVCEKNKADYSYAKDQLALIQEIKRALKEAGKDSEVRLACEYVLEIKDEGWRDAIEAFLGRHRYAVIADPGVFHIANAVMDRSRYRYVELVNTKRLMEHKTECVDDSLYDQLVIPNTTAAAYFKYWLGRIHAVEKDRVADYDNAISREGKLSRNMAITYVNYQRIGNYTLGAEAVRLNMIRARRTLTQLEAEEKEILQKEKEILEEKEFLSDVLNAFKEYDYGVHRREKETRELLTEEKDHYEMLLRAQKDNEEFMALNNRIRECSERLKGLREDRAEKEKRKNYVIVQKEELEKKKKTLAQEENAQQELFSEQKRMRSSIAEEAKRQYDEFLSGNTRSGSDVMSHENRRRRDNELEQLKVQVLSKQQNYNNRKADTEKLPEGLDKEAAYQNRRGRIWIDDLQGVRSKLGEQTLHYEKIFKHEFVLNIYEAARAARSDIAEINRELRKLQFSTRYQFDVKLLNDRSDYAKILQYAEYLEKTNNLGDGQMTIGMLTEYDEGAEQKLEEELRAIINRMLEKNDSAEMKKYSDYRNYMSYEIIINNDSVKDGRLSKQVGYNSGAGTQIPYTLILSASLSMLYNVRENSVRLFFIDEPFEKMSDHNIRLMLDFFRAQQFQVIFCAPDKMLESIGNACGVIIPVLKNSNDDMQIGQVRFHESK